MCQRVINLSLLMVFCWISGHTFGATDDHTVDVKLKFPDGLLGDDHGILTPSDLAINACEVRPKPFSSPSQYYPYEYWRCYESKTISLNCNSNGIPDKHEGITGLIALKISNNQENIEYIGSGFWPIKECKDFLKDVADLLKGTLYACISGSFILTEKDSTGFPMSSWIFGRIKTKRGCEGRQCDFSKKFKRENCPTLKL